MALSDFTLVDARKKVESVSQDHEELKQALSRAIQTACFGWGQPFSGSPIETIDLFQLTVGLER